MYRAILAGLPDEEVKEIASYYDYLEIQPTGNNNYLIRDPRFPDIHSVEDLQAINKKILALGDELGKLTVATCDVHFLNPEDALARKILQAGMGYPDEEQPPLYLRTTEEMLEEFPTWGTGPMKWWWKTPTKSATRWSISSRCPTGTSCIRPPSRSQGKGGIPELRQSPRMVRSQAAEDRGGPAEAGTLLHYRQRVLGAVLHRPSAGEEIQRRRYMVGSRGSVGSSFVATMLNITEVNPLVPHYRCPHCYHTEFFTDGSVGPASTCRKRTARNAALP